MTQTDGLLFDPNTYDPQQFDEETRRLLRATIDWFEGQGKKRILDDDLDRAVARGLRRLRRSGEAVRDVPDAVGVRGRQPEQALGRRPQRRARRDPRLLRPDLLVHRAGHHPRVSGRSGRARTRTPSCKAADDLEAGEVMAFGLSEREHGADVYNTDMVLTPPARRTAPTASCTGRRGRSTTSATATSPSTGVGVRPRATTSRASDAYVFFAADSQPARTTT